jgi:hypothetical protein
LVHRGSRGRLRGCLQREIAVHHSRALIKVRKQLAVSAPSGHSSPQVDGLADTTLFAPINARQAWALDAPAHGLMLTDARPPDRRRPTLAWPDEERP